jgi:ketosteroid isomerase-like protein
MAADEKAIRDADALWSHAVETKDLGQAISFYTDSASVLPFNAPSVTGTVQIRELWSHLMSTPGFSLHFAPSIVEVAHSGDLAYDVGTFELTLDDAQGKPVKTPGKYVVVWKQTGGKWKAAADIFNTDVKSAEKE